MNMRTIHLYPLCLLVLLAVGLGTSLNSCTNDLPGTDADNDLRPEDYVGKPVNFDGFTVTEVMTDADTRAVTRSDSRPFGEEGDVVTIKMRVEKDGSPVLYLADYVLSGGTWKPNEQNNLLCWESVNAKHNFTAYYPALTEQEKKEEEEGTRKISLPLDWTEEDYLKHGSLMQSPEAGVTIGSPVSLSLQLLLTRIEVSIDDATGITDATHLTMYTRTKGTVGTDGAITPNDADNDPQEMNLWRDTPASTTGTPANPVFRGYAIPQTYASGTTLLKHHTPDVEDARSYTVNYHPEYDGLTTKGGEIVSFTVAAIVSTVHVSAAGGLKDALKKVFPTGDYPTPLKITRGLNRADLEYLAKQLTTSGGQGVNITVVDMEGASVPEDALAGDTGGLPSTTMTEASRALSSHPH